MGIGALFSSDIVGTVRPKLESAQTQEHTVSIPELGSNWELASISDEAYSFDWQGVIAERVDLREKAAQYSDHAPAMYSFLGVEITPTRKIGRPNVETTTKITLGGGPLPISFTVDNPSGVFKKMTCGLDPHDEAVTDFAHQLFIQQTRGKHDFKGVPTVKDGFRKRYSPMCIREFGYDKPQYLDMGYTITVDWEAGPSDDLEDINFRGLLSVERWKERYLLVGGMVPDEEVSAGLFGDSVVENDEKLKENLIGLMENTELSTQ